MNNSTAALVDEFGRMSIAEQLEEIASYGFVVVDNNEMPEFANIDGEWVSFDALGEWFLAQSQIADMVCEEAPRGDEDMSKSIGDRCPNCGGSMIGDSCTMLGRCEYADSDWYEPDTEEEPREDDDQYQNYEILGITEAEHDEFMEEFDKLCDKIDQKNVEEKRKKDFARQDNIACALSALILLVLVVIPFLVFGEV